MKALILVDLQNDFCPGGALAVPNGDEVIAPAMKLAPLFDIVVATQDWHPANHGSFAVNHPDHNVGEIIKLDGLDQMLWPTHCVQGTPGSGFHADVNSSLITKIFQKGTDPTIDSYSGFFDNGHKACTGLSAWLKEQSVTQVYILGLATDYCVKFTALDAVGEGFQTFLVLDACRGVNVQPDDDQKAIECMKDAGVRLTTSMEILTIPKTV